MATTKTLETAKLTPTVGAEVLDVDLDRIRTDKDLPDAVMDALEENGVLVFRRLQIDDDTQVAFSRQLGEVRVIPGNPSPGIIVISRDPAKTKYDLRSNVRWHCDGTTRGPIPDRATILSAKVTSPEGGETEFASCYAAYGLLSDEEKERYATLRVIHSFAASQRLTHPNPTSEQLADWVSRGSYEYPLVWPHRSGRRSLMLGSSAEYVVGMDPEDSRALLDDLLRHATAPDRVYTHRWSVGDTVIWDNPGMVHRVLDFDERSGRELHRTTLAGDEPS